MKRLRIYADTSVIGGCFDRDFQQESRTLLQMAKDGKLILLVSDILALELERAPRKVAEEFVSLPPECLEAVSNLEEAERLRDLYLEAEVVGRARKMDAHHVALATVARADMIVSWNFKHIVHYEKIRGFNAVNIREGYPAIEIRTPKEVI